VSRLWNLGITILVLAACCGTAAAQVGAVSFTFSSAYNCDLLATDGELAAATGWSASHTTSNCALFDLFAGHYGMNSCTDRICYYVNDRLGVPVSGTITTSYGTYQLGPAAVANPATLERSPNVIVFGRSLDPVVSPSVTVFLPAAQQGAYSSVNFLLVYWHFWAPTGSAVNPALNLSAVYASGSSQVFQSLYTGTLPGWTNAPCYPFQPALTCSLCLGEQWNSVYWSNQTWDYKGYGGPWRMFEFSPSFLPPTWSTSTLIGFQFSSLQASSSGESLAVILAGAGCPAPDPPSSAPSFTLSLDRPWVYQNTPATLSRGGHISNLAVTITNSNGNSSFTTAVQAVTGSGGGQVTPLSGANVLTWVIQGGSRSDGSTGAGPVTLQVTVRGNTGGQATQQIVMTVRKLGDIDGSGTVDGNDLFLMNQRLDGFDVSYGDAAFDLTCHGTITTGDRVLLNLVLHGLPVP
jgi:hypothetical protein